MYQPSQTLTINNAQTVLAAGLRAIADGQTKIDLSELTAVDSAAVATLLAWKRAAQKRGVSLAFSNLPANLQSLVDLYGVTELLQSASPNSARTDLPHH